MINVLVTSLGSNTAIGVIKALRKYPDISITGTDSFPAHLSAGSPLADHFFTVPLALADGYESRLIEIIKKKQIDCVIPIHDIEVQKVASLALKYPNLTFWAVNKPELIDRCNNKKSINSFLLSHGFAVPAMYQSVKEASLPLIYKPNEGVSSKGLQVISDVKELSKPFDLDNGFLQHLVNGEEFTVDCYSAYREDLFRCCVRKRIETKEGISTKGVTVDYPLVARLSEQIHSLLQFKGASNIQFIVENDIAWFIEINPRFSGGGILSYQANLNSPLFTVLESVQSTYFNDIKELPVKNNLFMTRYWNENFYEG